MTTWWKTRAAVLCLLLLFFGQLAFGARHLSLTADEPAHIVRGYVYLTSDDFWMLPVLGHPPLIEGWAALPLLMNADRPQPTEVPHWKENTALYIQGLLPRLGTVAHLEILTRIPVMLLATLLMALVFRWTSELAGAWGGVWAAGLMAWDPTMIAHAQLDTTDLGVTLLVFAAAYVFWKMARQPTPGRLVATGLLTGLAMAAKHTGTIGLLLMGLLVLWGWFQTLRVFRNPKGLSEGHSRNPKGLPEGLSQDPNRRRLVTETWRWAGRGVVILLVSILTLWAVYRFETGRLAGPPWILPFPSHIQSLLALFEGKDRIAFLRGDLREGGWWWYSLYVFLIKTPLPFIAAILLSLYDGLRQGWRTWLRDVPLWLFPVLYWIIAMRGGMNIGYRHLLPTFPFVYVLVGRRLAGLGSRLSGCGRRRWSSVASRPGLPATFAGVVRRPGWWVAMVFVAWYVLGTLWVYPYALAYFNELVGGAANGYRHVVDSNVDWGHSFKALAQYMQCEEIAEVRLSYWTWVDPAWYGVPYAPLLPAPQAEKDFPAFAPPAGIYAISATTLQGILLHDTNLYEWFRHQEPVAQPGYGVLVYRVDQPTPAPTWVGQCATPTSPLSPADIARGFGGQAQRIAYFDCTQSWLYPDGGRTAGWFVLHREALREADGANAVPLPVPGSAPLTPLPASGRGWGRAALAPLPASGRGPTADGREGRAEWISSRLAGARLSYVQERAGILPPFSIYEWTSSPPAPPATSVFLPSDPARPTDGLPLSTPVSFDGPLALRGYEVALAEERASGLQIELQTWWEVGSPSDRPFSLMGHMLDAQGNAVGVADGLGVPLTEMRQGDWLVQRHRFLLTEEATANLDAVWLQTGGYWLDTMERWPVLADGGVGADRVILTRLELPGL